MGKSMALCAWTLGAMFLGALIALACLPWWVCILAGSSIGLVGPMFADWLTD